MTTSPIDRPGTGIKATATAGYPVRFTSLLGVMLVLLAGEGFVEPARGDDDRPAIDQFNTHIEPILANYCLGCHGPDTQEGNMRVDELDPDMVRGPDAEVWHTMLDVLNLGDMPPEDETQLQPEERRRLVDWLTRTLDHAATLRRENAASVIRRLNREQYSNTLQDLLDVAADFAEDLPGDGLSPEGFRNNGHALNMSSLRMEHYLNIARVALDKAIVTEAVPTIHHFRIEMRRGINPDMNPDNERVILGNGGILVDENDFLYSEPELDKPFAYNLYNRRTHYLFDEGYIGNPTIKEEREFTEIFHSVFVDLRGSRGRFRHIDDGVQLEPVSQGGPGPNVKVVLREYPMEGTFSLRVTASKAPPPPIMQGNELAIQSGFDQETGDVTNPEAIVIDATTPKSSREVVITDHFLSSADDKPRNAESAATYEFSVEHDAVYQVELVYDRREDGIELSIDDWSIDCNLSNVGNDDSDSPPVASSVAIVELAGGSHNLRVSTKKQFPEIHSFLVTRLPEDSDTVVRFRSHEQHHPHIIGFVGTRRDDGQAFTTVGRPQQVASYEPQVFEFVGRLEDMTMPAYDIDNRNYLANLLQLGVWNAWQDQRAPVDLRIHGFEFESPYVATWPPQSHRMIFIDSPNSANQDVYAREILSNFMTRAYRRPPTSEELELMFGFWLELRNDFPVFEESIKETLVIVLSSPQFLYIHEPTGPADDADSTDTAGSRPLDDYELAARLSYFLWNTMPDEILFRLADQARLSEDLAVQTERMIEDPRSWEFVTEFADQWLDISRIDRVAVLGRREYTPEVRELMKQETYHFVNELLQTNSRPRNFIDSDFSMCNETLAAFYGLDGVEGDEFQRVSLDQSDRRGGVLTHASILTGHSSGVDSHPVRRGVWLTRRLLDDPPPDAPPNVPVLEDLGPEFSRLPVTEQLQMHRDNPACYDCHLQIDPWGIAFEQYDTIGLFRTNRQRSTAAELPDGTHVEDLNELKQYLLTHRHEDLYRSVIRNLMSYALGRSLSFADADSIDELTRTAIEQNYGLRDLVVAIVQHELFVSR